MRGASLLLSALLLGISCRLYDATITESPVSAAAVAGEPLQLNCAFDATSTGDTNWLFTPLSASPIRIVYRCAVVPGYETDYGVVTSGEGECHLIVLNPARTHAGTYTCVNAFDQGAASVVVLDSYPICQASQTDDLLTGEFITLDCHVNYAGPVSPLMRWSVADTGEPVTNDTTHTDPTQVNSAISVPVFPPTSRPYVCETYFNAPITFSHTWSLPPINVQYFVEYVIALTRVHYFQQPFLVCSANGYPTPTYTWINLNTGASFPGNQVNVNPNGVSLYGCNASNTIRGETRTVQIAVATNITQEVPEDCALPIGTSETTPEPTTSTTPTPSTPSTPTTTPTTTPEPIPVCGRNFSVVPNPPDAPSVPNGWSGMCYITQNDTDSLLKQCRQLIVDLPPGYADYNALLAAGGNFGCSVTSRGDFLQSTDACVDGFGQTSLLSNCPSCPRMFMCFRLPVL